MIRRVLWGAAACLGIVLAARLIAGPFNLIGIPVNAPLNGEGAFGALVTVLLAWTAARRPELVVSWPWPVLAAASVAAIAFIPAFEVGFLSDDFIIVEQARAGLGPVFTRAGGDGFFRPLGYVSWAVDAGFAGRDAAMWHVTGWLLHMANSALVALLARRLGAANLAACVAGVLFALHGTHLEAAVWIAGRFDLLATFFTLGALLWFGKTTWAAIACAVAALLSKEAAYILPGLIAWIAWREHRGWRPVLPFLGVTLAAFVYRWTLLGGIGGYRDTDGAPSFFALRIAPVAKIIFARLWNSLYFPINWSTEPDALLILLGAVYIAALLWLGWNARPGIGLRVALGMLLVSILPPLHLLGGAADLSGGRLLYLPSVFFCAMLGLAFEGLERKHALAAAAILIAFHAAALRHDFPFWHAAGEQVQAICQQAGEPIRMIDGVPALANGYDQCVTMLRRF